MTIVLESRHRFHYAKRARRNAGWLSFRRDNRPRDREGINNSISIGKHFKPRLQNRENYRKTIKKSGQIRMTPPVRLCAALYHDPRIIALIPVLAVIIDYSLTFLLAGSTEMILVAEASPLVRFAVAQGLMPLYVTVLVLFYYGASYFVLRLLAGGDLYPLGVALIMLMGITHLLGGLSWYILNPLYSDTVVGLSFMSIIIAIVIFGYAVARRHPA